MIKNGYLIIGLCKNGKRKTHRVNRLVAEAFIPNVHHKPEVNHLNTIKDDNRVENLEWCTGSENMKHAYKTGVHRITKKHIDAIKKANYVKVYQYDLQGNFIKEWESQTEAAKQMKTYCSHISDCCLGKRKTAGGYMWGYKEGK